MNLYRPHWTVRLRHWLIRKLGGYVHPPPVNTPVPEPPTRFVGSVSAQIIRSEELRPHRLGPKEHMIQGDRRPYPAELKPGGKLPPRR